MVGLTESVTIAIALPALLRVQAEVGRLLVAVQLGLAWDGVGREQVCVVIGLAVVGGEVGVHAPHGKFEAILSVTTRHSLPGDWLRSDALHDRDG